MIEKERRVPLKIRKLEALLRRLPASHPKYAAIENELSKSMAGYRGERSLDYYLQFLPEKEYFIFHDIRLQGTHSFFQIDILILSASFLLILEVKHMTGSLIFNQQLQQLTRVSHAGEQVFANPILQAERQAEQLLQWLQRHKYPQVPVEFLVVMSHEQALIKETAGQVTRVIRSEGLQKKIHLLEQFYATPRLSQKEIRRLGALFLKQHTPQNPDILRRFHIEQTDILTGVHCPFCERLAMERERGRWICPHCHAVAQNSQITALADYALLFGPVITNRELRAFLHISSTVTAWRFLQSLNLSATGSTRGKAYHLPTPDE